MAIFPGEPGSAGFASGPPFLENNLWVSGTRFSWVGCASCHPTISVKALKGTESTNPN